MIERRRLVRDRDGRIRLRLPEEERQVLAAVAAELAVRLEEVGGAGGPHEVRPDGPDEIRPLRGEAGDAGSGGEGGRALPADLVRLFPPAHAEDPAAEREYRLLVGDELLDGKRDSLRVFVASLERDELAEEELEVWLRVLNDLRLVLGTRLDVNEETYARPLDARDPDAPELALFGYLSWLQEQAVEAAAAGFPGR